MIPENRGRGGGAGLSPDGPAFGRAAGVDP